MIVCIYCTRHYHLSCRRRWIAPNHFLSLPILLLQYYLVPAHYPLLSLYLPFYTYYKSCFLFPQLLLNPRVKSLYPPVMLLLFWFPISAFYSSLYFHPLYKHIQYFPPYFISHPRTFHHSYQSALLSLYSTPPKVIPPSFLPQFLTAQSYSLLHSF